LDGRLKFEQLSCPEYR